MSEDGREHVHTLSAADNLCRLLGAHIGGHVPEEVSRILRDVLPAARRSLGPDHSLTLSLSEKNFYAALQAWRLRTSNWPEGTTDSMKLEALNQVFDPLDELASRRRRVLGATHHDTLRLEQIRQLLAGTRQRLTRMYRDGTASDLYRGPPADDARVQERLREAFPD